MAKKKPEEHVNHERWLVSYADFITLLFATFTALFAISNVEKARFAALSKSLNQAFNSGAEVPGAPGVFADGGSNPDSPLVIKIFPAAATQPPPPPAKTTDTSSQNDSDDLLEGSKLFKSSEKAKSAEEPGSGANPEPPKAATVPAPGHTPTPTPAPTATPESPTIKAESEGRANAAMAAEIKELLNSAGLKDVVAVRQESRGTVISLGEAAFFAPGSVDVYPQSSYQFDKIVNVLRNKRFEIRVEGHTDNMPVTSGHFRSNLELSTLRAARIVDFMIREYRFQPETLSSTGFGEWRPIADNATEAGRRKNRRVDIVILNQRTAAQDPH